MLAYLIIGIELAILYTVFWYVFLREPRPYKIRENIWGYYPGAGQDSAHTDNGCRHCNSQADANQKAREEEWRVPPFSNIPTSHLEEVQQRYQNAMTPIELLRSQQKGIEKIHLPGSHDEGGKNYRACTQRLKVSEPRTFLSKLGESLNTMNIKLP